MQNLWNHFLLFCTPTWPGVSSREWKPRIAERTKIASDVTAGMLVERTKAKKSFGNLTLFLCKTCWGIFYCFVHQHGPASHHVNENQELRNEQKELIVDCTWRHGGHVGRKNKSEKVFWEFDSIFMQNLWSHFLLFCTPTWPSHHVNENQELRNEQKELIVDCTWRHGGHVGRKNKSDKVFWEFDSIFVQNLSYIFQNCFCRNIAVLSRECNPRVVFVHRHGVDGVTWKPPIVQFWSVLTRYNGHNVLLL